MKTNLPSTCSTCRFFKPEGSRRGSCDRLCVTVASSWLACHIAQRAFALVPEAA